MIQPGKSAITNLSEQRLKDVDNGYPSYSPSYWVDKEYNIGQIPQPPKENTDPNYNEWNTFYATKRGHHPRSTRGSTESSQFSLANFPVAYHIDKISPSPILFITGDSVHSKQFSVILIIKLKILKSFMKLKVIV